MTQTITLPLIADIKRHSLEDGPGIRSVVFFKGCPMRCVFCHNPEMQDPDVEIAFAPDKCVSCGNCSEVCPEEAIDLHHAGRIIRDRCERCGLCADACPGNALRSIGTPYSPGELTDILLRDRSFYRHSGGGVTLSGGECTMYPDYLEILLQSLKSNNIHIALETSGYFDDKAFDQKILPYIDLIYFDIKIADSGTHLKYTGRGNHRILQNYCRLAEQNDVEIHPRIPIVPGITDTGENLSAIVDFLWDAGTRNVTLLPYNPLGADMANSLGRRPPNISKKFLKAGEQEEVSAMLKSFLSEKQRSKPIEIRQF